MLAWAFPQAAFALSVPIVIFGLEPEELLAGAANPKFREAWVIALADSFAPAGELPATIAAE